MININHHRYISSGLVIFLGLVVFFIGCTGHAKEKDEVQGTDPIKMPIPPENKLSPGMAQIEAHLLKMEKVNGYYKSVIKVEKVLAYGMSTKPIGKDSEIVLKIAQDEVDLINLFGEGTIEQKYVLTVEQEQLVDNQVMWRAVKVKKKNIEQ